MQLSGDGRDRGSVLHQADDKNFVQRYFFNIYAVTTHLDDRGQLFVDDRAAWAEGMKVAVEFIGDLHHDFRPDQQFRLEVTDKAKAVLFVIQFSSARVPPV
jgi:hypothetical protein